MPATYHLELYQGDDHILVMQRLSTEGNPLPLDDSVIQLAAKRSFSDPRPLLLARAQIINSPLGKFAFVIPSDATKQISMVAITTLVFDVSIKQSGFTHTLFAGELNITPEVH